MQVSRLVRSLKIGVPAEQQAERGDGTFCDTTLVGFIFAASLFGFFFTVYFLGDILVLLLAHTNCSVRVRFLGFHSTPAWQSDRASGLRIHSSHQA